MQQALIKQLFNPMHSIRSGFRGVNRTEMAVDYYNRETLDRFEELMAEPGAAGQDGGTTTKAFFSQVSFDHVKSTEINRVLNALPTGTVGPAPGGAADNAPGYGLPDLSMSMTAAWHFGIIRAHYYDSRHPACVL